MPHILLPTDFSDASLNAARFALAHFGGARTSCMLLHAYPTPDADDFLKPSFMSQARKQALSGLRSYERKCEKLPGTASFARLALPLGLADALNELAEQEDADLIVMGAHGAGRNAFIGTTTTDVVLRTKAPLIVVPDQWAPVPIERILLAHDGGPMDDKTLAPLRKLAERKKAVIIVARVRNNVIAFDKGMDRKAIGRSLHDLPHSFVTVQGDRLAPTIDELAVKGRIQLVVSVHRVRGFWQGLLHRSKARRMALHTHVPLMVLRQPKGGPKRRTVQQEARWLYLQVRPS